MRRDTIGATFLVAAVLCIVCSVLVSAAAVGLRPIQAANKELYQKQNILIAAGMEDPEKTVDQLFENIESILVDLETGEPVSEGVVDPETYDPVKAAKNPELSIEIPADKDIAGIKRREKYARVYLVKENGKTTKIILPVYGKGLWSTLYGFLALDADLNTVVGLTFYSHGETPGLGGEVDNPNWKAKWPGKLLRGDSGDVAIEVVKGQVVSGNPKEPHQVDGLTGATITSRGVSNLVRYWVSEDAFGPFLEKIAAETSGGNNG